MGHPLQAIKAEKGKGGKRTLEQVDVVNRTGDGRADLTADCGTAARQIMGIDSSHEKYSALMKRRGVERCTKARRYQAIEMPSKRPARGPVPREYAQILLRDGTRVLVESYNTPAAERPRAEIEAHDGREVWLTGVVHQVVPSRGQAPEMPGILEVESIAAVTEPGPRQAPREDAEAKVHEQADE